MESNGVNVVIANQPYQTGYGENTMVWTPANLDATRYDTVFPFSGQDTVYSIVVTNIVVGLSTTGFAYTVTLFDPVRAGRGLCSNRHQRPGPALGGLARQLHLRVPRQSARHRYQWVVAQAPSGNLFDGAENGASNFIAAISPVIPRRAICWRLPEATVFNWACSPMRMARIRYSN